MPFTKWVNNSKKGDRYVYHTGFLLMDRAHKLEIGIGPDGGDSVIMLVNREPVHTEAKLVWQAYEKGHVTLFQRKLGKAVYEYIAERR